MDTPSELNKVRKKLKDLELALDKSSIVAITDNRGIIQYANRKFSEISKYAQEELIGSYQSIVNSGHHPRSFFKDMWKTIGTGNVWQGEIKNKAKDGSYYWVDTTIVPFLKENGKPYQYISIRHNITRRKKYEQYIETMAYSDPLTQLPNRNQLIKWVTEYPQKTGETVTAFFLDIDHFKSINDNYGHDIGDFVLQEIAIRLRNAIRETDFVSRQGGDEFTIILNNNDDKEVVTTIAENILHQISVPIPYENKQIIITASIGISMGSIPEDMDSPIFIETLIKNADTAMYHAKREGGNDYCFNTKDQNKQLNRTYEIESNIKNALTNHEFYMVYQPLINLNNNQIVGMEALIRWNNKKLGVVSPGEFIPVLEKSGSIVPVGKWILETVCKQMKNWQENGIVFERISVNVSPIQLKNRSFIKDLQEILNNTEMDPSYIELEITEGTILEVNDSAIILQNLQDLGVKISIDDFGTGYSSLSYLKELPINTLKIDKSFIRDLDINGEIIANTIINMGKNLRFRVIAEGIENKEQLTYLQRQKCHEGQGYYFSKPVRSEETTKLFKQTQT